MEKGCALGYLSELLKVLIPNPNKYSALLRKFRAYFSFISALRHKLEYKNERE